MTDAINQPINIGDYVIVSDSGYSAPYLQVVQSFTPRMVKIAYINGKWPTTKDPKNTIVVTDHFKNKPELFI